MAEFLTEQHRAKRRSKSVSDGFNALGKPIPMFRRTCALHHCQQMGLSTDASWEVVGAVAEQLERDEPYEAMAAGMRHLDLTGTYRLMAVLLTAAEPVK